MSYSEASATIRHLFRSFCGRPLLFHWYELGLEPDLHRTRTELFVWFKMVFKTMFGRQAQVLFTHLFRRKGKLRTELPPAKKCFEQSFRQQGKLRMMADVGGSSRHASGRWQKLRMEPDSFVRFLTLTNWYI